ncbi:transmembrane emp24 domain-containing protein p24delta7 [Arachis duranensis]|uniref:Transmembrane emp24 domain-containing protein p24delta7 n=1 Tax=Arachis duranensis TaxID=130453 RepID=A0A6P4D856_ARADU|nr:transmembrane emp24 domain-containing protein p24delta7 [Arachis duranensis]
MWNSIHLHLHHLLLLIVVVAPSLLLCSLVESVQLELKSGHTKCISEEISDNAMSVGNYIIVNPNEGYPIPNSHKITVRVSSPRGISYHYAETVDSGTFWFNSKEAGDYTACFWAIDHSPAVTLIIDFDWKSGVTIKDWSKVAKKGHVEAMELELKKLFDTLSNIHYEMLYLRKREEQMQELNKMTNKKMFTFSLLSLLVCLSVAGLQLWHLKLYFVRKKVL